MFSEDFGTINVLWDAQPTVKGRAGIVIV